MANAFEPCAGIGATIRALPFIHPALRRLPPPIIVIGMHRSGTSLVSGMLSHLGVYMDPDAAVPDYSEPLSLPSDSMRRAGYGEAVAFRKLNERILHSVGSDWDNVEEFLKRRGDRQFDRRCILSMQGATFGSIRNRYLNLAPSGGLRSWGWKDPRTSLTLAYWLVLFPKARIIHVRRDTEHVIDSLERRERAELAEASASRTGTWARILRIASDPAYRSSALRRRLGLAPYAEKLASCESGWRALAETYVRECEEWRLLGERYTEVRYEEILQDPYSHALRLADYAETRPSLVTVRRAADFVIREPSQKTDRRVSPRLTAAGGLTEIPVISR